jgi:hypothetical protein
MIDNLGDLIAIIITFIVLLIGLGHPHMGRDEWSDREIDKVPEHLLEEVKQKQ